jgi:hypothetical protein
VVELLAHAIRNNSRITGIKIGDREWKISQSVDDTCLFLADEDGMTLSFIIIDLFAKCTG